MRVVRLASFAAFICLSAAAQPRIDAVDPSQGPIAGGTAVTIRGANLADVPVTLDRKPITPLSQTASEIRLQMPPHDNGYAIVGIGEDAHTRFLYVPPVLRDLPPAFITTVAGIGHYSGEYGPALEAGLQPTGMAFDSANTLYFADPPRNRVYRVRNGILEPFAGTGLDSRLDPKSGLAALDTSISFPRCLAFDSHGNVYVPDNNYYLWRVSPAGIAEIAAGTGRDGFSGDGGPARQATIGQPSYVAIDRDDNVYFTAWSNVTNVRVRKIDRNGIITTYAGKGPVGFSGDGGPAVDAQFDPSFVDFGALALDHEDNLYLADVNNSRIRRIDHGTGIISTAVGPTIDGHQIPRIEGVAVSANDELYFSGGSEVYKRAASGTITRITTGARGFSEDGALFSDTALNRINAIGFDRNGAFYFSETNARRVRMVDAGGRIRTMAGIGPRTLGEGGPAIAAALVAPNLDLDVLPTGELALTNSDRLVKIDSSGNFIRFAGTGIDGALADVPATAAFMTPASLSANPDGTIDYATGTLGLILRIGRDGIVRRIAGKQTADCSLQGDGGNALNAVFCQPWDALSDRDGNLYIADTENNRIRRVDAHTGVISTFAGSGPANGLERYGSGTTCGDGGPATSACINTPYGVELDDAGNLYVAENWNRIRKIDRSGIITTFAATGTSKLAWAFGNLFTVRDAVTRVSPAGVVTMLTASTIGFSGDGGPATAAQISATKQTHGVAIDAEGNLFFHDGDNRRIRAIRYGAVLAPPGSTIVASGNGSIRATVFDGARNRAAGVRVEFSAPASGPSCVLSSTFAITDANGEVSVNCTSNCIDGAYTVTVTPLGSSQIMRVARTNAGPCGRHRTVRH